MIFPFPSKNSIDAVGQGLAECGKIFENLARQFPEKEDEKMEARAYESAN